MGNRLFSEMYEEALHDNSYALLKGFVDELHMLLKENAYLKAENESLRESNKRYADTINESNESFREFMGRALTGLVNGGE